MFDILLLLFRQLAASFTGIIDLFYKSTRIYTSIVILGLYLTMSIIEFNRPLPHPSNDDDVTFVCSLDMLKFLTIILLH